MPVKASDYSHRVMKTYIFCNGSLIMQEYVQGCIVLYMQVF